MLIFLFYSKSFIHNALVCCFEMLKGIRLLHILRIFQRTHIQNWTKIPVDKYFNYSRASHDTHFFFHFIPFYFSKQRKKERNKKMTKRAF